VFSVKENSASGTAVGTVSATDGDATAPNNVIASYAITNGNTGSVFAINPTTGAITVVGSIDREATATFALTVTATDSGTAALTGSAIITVNVLDVNDRAPVVNPASFSVQENSLPGTPVNTITASDGDATSPNNVISTYTITGGSGLGLFAISSTGAITVSGAIDREVSSSFTLLITATDSGTDPSSLTTSSAGTITIDIGDVNDNSPVVVPNTFTVTENSAVGVVVGTVAASDADATVANNAISTFAITSGNTGNVFSISNAGVITVAASIDRETTAKYTLTVQATDSGKFFIY
jgi:hypothetical protein